MKSLFSLTLFFCFSFIGCNKAQFISDPQNTYVIIAGALEWKDALSPFDNKNRKDAEFEQKIRSMGVPSDKILAFYDAKATLSNIKAAIEKFSTAANSESRILFYYAGHGLNEKEGIYFANYDIDLKNVKNTGFAISTLSDKFGKSKASEIWLLADCCYSGGLLAECQKLGKAGKKAVALSSATASNTSTGNWTYTQTLLDCLDGRPWADLNSDGNIDLGELKKEIRQAMKYRERQMNGAELAGVDESTLISKTKGVNGSSGTGWKVGDYAWGKYGKDWKPVRILSANGTKYNCEFYFYSDKVTEELTAESIKPMHFVKYKEGSAVEVEWKGKWYAATVKKAGGDFCYISYKDYDATYDEWVLYDRVRTGKEQKVQVKDGSKYYPALILDEKDGKYFIHYNDWDNTWDEWVTKDRIK